MLKSRGNDPKSIGNDPTPFNWMWGCSEGMR